MKLAVSSTGPNLESQFDPRFGRCPFFLIINTETMQWSALDNGAAAAAGGAGIKAAETVIEAGVEAVLSGSLGPNAFNVLRTAKIPSYGTTATTVSQAVEQFKAGKVTLNGAPTAPGHSGQR